MLTILAKPKNAKESPTPEKANIVNSAIKFSIFVIPFQLNLIKKIIYLIDGIFHVALF